MGKTNIEWCDFTLNYWIGCSKVSPACKFCYAETLDTRRFSRTLGEGTTEKPVKHWGKGAPRWLTSTATHNAPYKWNRQLWQCANCGEWEACPKNDIDEARAPGVICGNKKCRRMHMMEKKIPRVFCSSLSDWLDDEVPVGWLLDMLRVIFETRNLRWMMLTKRPENWFPRLDACIKLLCPDGDTILSSAEEALFQALTAWAYERKAPAHIMFGVTVENQAEADKRIPEALKVPARWRFLSCEPLLGSLRLDRVKDDELGANWNVLEMGIHLVVCGGESGEADHDIRPTHPDWISSLRRQCTDAGVPFFFKQWGDWLPRAPVYSPTGIDNEEALNGTDPTRQIQLESDGSVAVGLGPWREGFYQPRPELDPWIMERVGKKAAGRLLGGVEYNGFPNLT